MFTRPILLVALVVISSSAIVAATDESVTGAHIRGAVRQRRAKSAKGAKKAGGSGSGSAQAGAGGDQSRTFQDLLGKPILGKPTVWNSQGVTSLPNFSGGGTTNGNTQPVITISGESGSTDVDDSMDGGGSAMSTTPAAPETPTDPGSVNRGADCNLDNPSVGKGADTTDPVYACKASCECDSGCCVAYHGGVCAPAAGNGRSTLGNMVCAP
mmetsp:Transcript_36161/g.79172  ORF Transcript_36161/g.79172 Transcript_36161/m.79172 type:complete len:212 (-) Transcript_36161:249-884(-)|eukprot:CAMPEP_0178502436 /NCGR_PEP_ID=MMETSP0696-20121128/17502_1 /TAXON_ID=265572 /ORGANISM="Extubocellulus spinifer, Strain CCMP396" /LENGTH=211 /DNA_ID=CAMNT_0020131491 /DNA_START=184 /DNA_END=819 /DNA_ORIENTATION=+